MTKARSIADEFSEAVNAHLASLETKVDAALARLVESDAAAAQWLLFEYDSPRFAETFAVTVVPMLAGGASGEPRPLLDDGSLVVPPAIYDDPHFEEAEPWDTASELLEQWLVKRWSLIPGSRPPAFVAHHDSFFKTDMADGGRTSDDELYARFKLAVN